MNIVTRDEWGARAPKYRNEAPLSAESTAHWNGPIITISKQITWDHSKCAGLVRGIQNFHMDGKGWSDIAYNFIICPHGYTFDGRGLNVINGANGTNSGNRSSHAVMCLAGDGNHFSDVEKIEFRECIVFIAEHTLAPNSCKGHRDHKPTACPGDARYDWVHQGMPINGEGPISPSIPTIPTTSTIKFGPILKLGSTGDAVKLVQTIIRDKAGGGISVDGIFGPRTEKRVKDVQTVFKLTVDGIVGPKTWAALHFLTTL